MTMKQIVSVPKPGAALLALLGALAIALVFFALFPAMDLAIAERFYEVQGGRFYEPVGFWRFLYADFENLSYLLLGLIAVATLLAHRRKRPLLNLTTRRGAFILLLFALGPGLIVNVGFKENWDRARPRDIVEFGGDRNYSAPLMPSDQCERNCAFVSGHAALAFAYAGFAVLAPATLQPLVLLGAAAFGLLIGTLRMLQGAHFLSDVIFAGLIVASLGLLLRSLILRDWGGKR